MLFSGRVGTFKNIYSVPSRRMYHNTSAAITERSEAPVPLLSVARVQQLFPLPPFQREGGVVILSTGMQSDWMYGSYSPHSLLCSVNLPTLTRPVEHASRALFKVVQAGKKRKSDKPF